MGALLNPVDLGKKGSIKWGLVAFASAMFTFATISTATNLDIQSISYINNREFTSTEAEGVSIPGPMGYQVLISANAINVTPYTMFFLNQWLADGLLVGSVPNAVVQISNVCRSSSSIVVMSFME